MSDHIAIPRKISRRFEKVLIPKTNLETGEKEYEERVLFKGRIVIPVSECEVWTHLSPKTIKRYMRQGKLTPLEANGSERKEKKQGNYPLFFDLKEFDEMKF